MWGRPSVELSSDSQGRRLLFLAAGSRGDVQPLVALSAGCKKAGFEVMVATQKCHKGFFEDFSLRVEACDEDDEDGEARTPKAMFGTGAGTDGGELSAAHQGAIWEIARDFKPALIISCRPCLAAAHAFAWRLNTPVMELHLQLLIPTRTARSPLCKSPGSLGCVRYANWIRYRRSLFRECEQMQLPAIREALKEAGGDAGGVWSGLQAHLLDNLQPVAPGPIGVSPLVVKLPSDCPPELSAHGPSGFVVVSWQEQMTKADDYFGCRNVLRAFLDSDKDEKPVYFGFGPSIAGGSKHMAELVVGAAMDANVRGAVLCGSADLGPPALVSSDEKLQAYAGRCMVFVRSAPHEWLFDKCSVLVHHGGVGTTNCALRSGTPQIVLPTTPEERQQASMVTSLGVGLDLGPLAECTSSALSRAVQRLRADVAMVARCKDLGSRLRDEEGVKAAIEHIDRFFKEKVVTGQWEHANRRRRREHDALRSGAADGCFVWLGRFVCGISRTNFAPKLRGKV